MRTHSQNTLMLGDFKVHHEDSLNTDALDFHDILSNYSPCQHVSGHTHMSTHTLYLVITKLKDNLMSNTTGPDFLRDHSAVHCCLHLPKSRHLRYTIKYSNYGVIDKEVFCVDIETSSLWTGTVASAACLFHTILSILLDKYALV